MDSKKKFFDRKKPTITQNPRAWANATISLDALILFSVKLFSTSENNDIGFNLIHEQCGCRLHQGRMLCEKCMMEVEKDQITRGFEYKPGKFVKISHEETAGFSDDYNGNIKIIKFVPFSSIDPIYFNDSYFLLPEKGKMWEKVYSLFTTALIATNKVAIASYGNRGKVYTVLIRVLNGDLVLHTLKWGEDVRIGWWNSYKNYNRGGFANNELSLLTMLIEQKSNNEWEASEYKDPIRDGVKKLVETKVSSNKKKKLL